MKKFINKKILFIIGLFIFFIILNCNTSRAEGVLVTDGKYNSSFITDHLAVGQNPFEAFNEIIDYYNQNYPDAMSLSSSDLPKYGLLVKHETNGEDIDGNPSDGELLGYTIFYSSTPALSDHIKGINALEWAFYMPLDETGEYPYYFYCHLTPGGLKFSSSGLSQGVGLYRPRIYTASDLNHARFLIASNYDVYGHLNYSNQLVFQQPTLRKVTTLAPVVNKVEMSPVLTEIIQILPLIIVVLVSLVGLRKALKMLFTVLRHS